MSGALSGPRAGQQRGKPLLLLEVLRGRFLGGETGRFLEEEREGGTQVVWVTLNFYGHFEFLLL